METISGGPSDETRDFQPNTILEAAKLNKALENWVVTEVPGEDEGEIGDVVFVTGPGSGGSPGGGGKVLQIVRATDGTQRTTTSTSYVDANLSVTITPQKSDSALLLIATAFLEASSTTDSQNRGRLQITDSSNNSIAGAENSIIGVLNLTGASTRAASAHVVLIGYATPATTSAVTYKTRFKSEGAATTITLANNQTTAQLFAIEVSA